MGLCRWPIVPIWVGVALTVFGLTGCAGSPSASSIPDGAPSVTDVVSTTVQALSTTTIPVGSTTVPVSITIGTAGVRPAATTEWELAPGDVLVANGEGVHQIRDGAVLARPVTSPTFAAVADGLGGLIVQPIEADPPAPAHLPDGALELWRVTPDGSTTLIYRSNVEQHATDDLELFDVALVEELSQYPSLLFVEGRCLDGVDPYCHQQDLLLALPLDGGSEPIVITAPVGSWEGGIGGVAWEGDTDDRFLISMSAEGRFWMSAWDAYGLGLAWPTNPNPHDSGESIAVFAMTGIRPGLIAYTEMQQYYAGLESKPVTCCESQDLVIYHTDDGTEEQRVTIDAPGWVFLHANAATVAVTARSWREEDQTEYYLPALSYDTLTWEVETLTVAGRATVVSPPFCCDASVTPTDLVVEGTREPYTFEETQAFGEFGPVLWGLVTTLSGETDIPHGPGNEWVTWGPLWGGRLPGQRPYDVYGVTDLSALDVDAIAAVIPRGQTIVVREVRWSLDELESFKNDLNGGAPGNGVCSTGFGGTANRIRLVATSALDLGDVPLDAVAIETVDECPVYSNEPAVTP